MEPFDEAAALENLTVDKVRALYEKHGLEPIQGDHRLTKDGKACGACILGILAIDGQDVQNLNRIGERTPLEEVSMANMMFLEDLEAGWEKWYEEVRGANAAWKRGRELARALSPRRV